MDQPESLRRRALDEKPRVHRRVADVRRRRRRGLAAQALRGAEREAARLVEAGLLGHLVADHLPNAWLPPIYFVPLFFL